MQRSSCQNVSVPRQFLDRSAIYLHNIKGLDLASVLDVRTPTQVNQTTTPVYGTLFSSNQLFNVVQLIFAVGEHLPEVLLCDLQPIKALFLLQDRFRFVLERRPIASGDDTAIFDMSYCMYETVLFQTTYLSGMAIS